MQSSPRLWIFWLVTSANCHLKLHGRFLCLVLLVLFSIQNQNLFGQILQTSPLVLDSASKLEKNTLMFAHLVEQTHTTIESIQTTDASQWTQPGPKPLNLIHSDSAIWFTSNFKTGSLKDPNWVFSYNVPVVESIDFFLLIDKKLIKQQKLGSKVPHIEREYPSNLHVFPITLENHKEYKIYLRVKTQTQMLLDTTLAPESKFQSSQQNWILVLSFYFGACLVMLCYNLLLFINTGDRTFLYYVLVVSTVCAYGFIKEGFAQQVLWPSNGSLSSPLLYISASTSFLFSNLFTLVFLKLKDLNSILYKSVIAFITLDIFCMVAALVGEYSTVMVTIGSTAIINYGIFLIAGYVSWKAGNTHAIYYLLAWTPISICIVLRTFGLLGIIDLNEIIADLLKVSRIIEFVMLSTALTAQINLLKSQQERANQENKAKNRFLSKMSFQIRTPMTGVIGLSELLAKQLVDETNRKYNQVIQTSGRALLTTLDDIVDYSSMEAGTLEIKNASFKVKELLDESLSLFERKAEESGITLTGMAAPSMPKFINSDRARLKQVIINLVGNAFKFTESGEIRVELAADPHVRDYYQITVQDTGIGMKPEVREKLFASYEQADRSTARVYGGTGLGLSICKQLAELMQGEVSVSSTEGIGSTFEFRFRAQTDQQKEANHYHHSLASKKHLKPKEIHILVAEDNPVASKIISNYLTVLGFNFTLVENGSKAVLHRTQNRNRYQLILMDCDMPIADGWHATEVIRRWESQERETGIPIIAVTACATPQEVDRCLSAGMNAHLAKPIEMNLLDETIQWVLNKETKQLNTGTYH